MRADFKVVLDACVLANFGVADLLLRLAEKPRLYLPFWSQPILDETTRTQTGALGWPPKIAASFRAGLLETFPEAMVSGHDYLTEKCTNDEKDRHVLACAIHCKAEIILTFNLRDFKEESLSPWGIQARHPQEYLLVLFSLEPGLVRQQLGGIAQKRGCSVEDHLIDLGRFLPEFASRVMDELNA